MPAMMQVVRDDEQQLRLANPWKWGPVIMLVGAALWYLSPVHRSQGVAYWLLTAGAAFAIIIGLLSFLTRDELRLDFASRSYVRRQGRWPSIRETTGSFSELSSLSVRLEVRRGRKGGQYPVWVVALRFAGQPQDLPLAEFRNEPRAYAKLQSWARKLAIPALETVDGRDRPLEEKPVSQQAKEKGQATLAPLPANSRIVFVEAPPQRMIVLPRLGFNAGILLLALIPAITLWMGIAGYNDALHRYPPRSTAFPVGVIAVGVLFAAAVVLSMLGRTIIQEDGNLLRISTRAIGWTYNVKDLPKQSIDDVEVRATALSAAAPSYSQAGMRDLRTRKVQPRPELFLRAGDKIVRIGQSLSATDLEWLRQAVLYLASN